MIEFSGFVISNGEITETHNLTEQEHQELQETVDTLAAIDAIEDKA